jgi:hypothetical protein
VLYVWGALTRRKEHWGTPTAAAPQSGGPT